MADYTDAFLQQFLIQQHLGRFQQQGINIDPAVAYQNMQVALNKIAYAESKMDPTAKNPKKGSTASGAYQFTQDSAKTAVKRLEKYIGTPQWLQEFKGHFDASKLPKSKQDLLMIGEMLEEKGSDEFLPGIFSGDDAALDGYYKKLHHTNPGPADISNWQSAVDTINNNGGVGSALIGQQGEDTMARTIDDIIKATGNAPYASSKGFNIADLMLPSPKGNPNIRAARTPGVPSRGPAWNPQPGYGSYSSGYGNQPNPWGLPALPEAPSAGIAPPPSWKNIIPPILSHPNMQNLSIRAPKSPPSMQPAQIGPGVTPTGPSNGNLTNRIQSYGQSRLGMDPMSEGTLRQLETNNFYNWDVNDNTQNPWAHNAETALGSPAPYIENPLTGFLGDVSALSNRTLPELSPNLIPNANLTNLEDANYNVPSTTSDRKGIFGWIGDKVEGMGITKPGMEMFGTLASGVGSLGDLVLGYKNYQETKDMMDYQKRLLSADYENQATMAQYQLNRDAYYRRGLNRSNVRAPQLKKTVS